VSDRTRTVLLIDDDPATALQVHAALPESRYRLVTAADAASAMHAVETGADAIVSELTLSAGYGLELLVEARLRFPTVPRIVLTALRDFDTLVASINEAEVFRFLRKPVDPGALLEAVEQAMAGLDSLHLTRRVQEAEERRRLALTDLETDHPGISFVARVGASYSISRHRLRVLKERLAGTPLADLMAGVADPREGPTPPS
jgi:DNA-binding NtrC family response regulator